MTVLEIHQIIETETNQTIGEDNTQITVHETIQTLDERIINITKDHLTFPRTEIVIIKIDKIKLLSHRIKTIHNINSHNKSIKVAHLNIKDKSTKYNQLKKPNQTLPVLIIQTENSELQLNHISCESTDDESEAENTNSINILQNENEYETPIESSYYQNINKLYQNSDNTQNTIDYTKQAVQVQRKFKYKQYISEYNK